MFIFFFPGLSKLSKVNWAINLQKTLSQSPPKRNVYWVHYLFLLSSPLFYENLFNMKNHFNEYTECKCILPCGQHVLFHYVNLTSG